MTDRLMHLQVDIWDCYPDDDCSPSPAQLGSAPDGYSFALDAARTGVGEAAEEIRMVEESRREYLAARYPDRSTSDTAS